VAQAVSKTVGYLDAVKRQGWITTGKPMELAYRFAREVVDVDTMKREVAAESFDTAAAQPTQDAADKQAGRDERALAELRIDWKNVMAFRVYSDRVVIIEGPVGYKRTYALPGAQEVEG
jgi:hypothetical protein